MTKKLKMLMAAVLVMAALLGISGMAKAEEPVVGCISYDDGLTCTGEGGGGASDPGQGYTGPNLPHNDDSSNSSNNQPSFTPPPCDPLCGPQPSKGPSNSGGSPKSAM